MPDFNVNADLKAREHGTMFLPNFNIIFDDHPPLLTAIAIEAEKNDFLMLAFMDANALSKTIETKKVHYYSRSRRSLWLKGETSGQIQHLKNIYVDCDQDALILKVVVDGDGGCCHLGEKTCFHRQVNLDNLSLTKIS